MPRPTTPLCVRVPGLRALPVVVLGLALAAVGCGRTTAGPERPPVVVASIYPVQSLLEQMVRPGARVELFMPPGSNPHNYSPTPSDMMKLSKADVLVVVGLGLDPWADRAAEATGRVGKGLAVVRLADLLGVGGAGVVCTDPEHDHHGHAHAPPHGHAEGPDHGAGTAGPAASATVPESGAEAPGLAAGDADGSVGADQTRAAPTPGSPGSPGSPGAAGTPINSHIWLDPGLMIRFASMLAESSTPPPALASAIDPRRARSLASELTALDAEFKARLAPLPRRELVTFHNAFDSLAERYGLKVVDHLVEIEAVPGGEVTMNDLKQAIEVIRRHQLRVIYAEPQFPSKAVDRIGQTTGVEVLLLDPEGDPSKPGYDSYQALLRSNVETLARGQSR